jgi:hypothetical protein
MLRWRPNEENLKMIDTLLLSSRKGRSDEAQLEVSDAENVRDGGMTSRTAVYRAERRQARDAWYTYHSLHWELRCRNTNKKWRTTSVISAIMSVPRLYKVETGQVRNYNMGNGTCWQAVHCLLGENHVITYTRREPRKTGYGSHLSGERPLYNTQLLHVCSLTLGSASSRHHIMWHHEKKEECNSPGTTFKEKEGSIIFNLCLTTLINSGTLCSQKISERQRCKGMPLQFHVQQRLCFQKWKIITFFSLTPWRQNQKVHHRIHNSPPTVPTLSQVNPLHTPPPPPPSLPKIYSNPILPSTPRSFMWSLSFRIFHQNSTLFSRLPCVPHAPPTSFSFWSA